MTDSNPTNLFKLTDKKVVADIFHKYVEKETSIPLIIDNGSYQCRVGWTSDESPRLVFRNLIAKPRKERVRKDNEPPTTPPIQIGNDITNIEAVRFQLKTQFDKDIVTHFEAQEQILDYIFAHIGIDTERSVKHPIVMTEALLNPNYTRNLMSELLFECYDVPCVTYGVDALLSFYYNRRTCIDIASALIISIGHNTTHVIPVINNISIIEKARRINIGGSNITSFLHKLLQLKYPAYTNIITPSRVEDIVHDHCYVSSNYLEEVKKWGCVDYYQQNVKKIQFPTPTVTVNPGLTPDQRFERRRSLARRLIEMNARKREDKLVQERQLLARLTELLQYLDDGHTTDLIDDMGDFDIKTYEDVEKAIVCVQARIEKAEQKAYQAATESTLESDALEESSAKNFGPELGTDINEWLNITKNKRQAILDHKAAKKQRRLDMVRRRTVAAQERMRIISQLARKEKGNDDFGIRDEDWDVYKTISKEGGDSDSEEENEKLAELEDILRQYDPSFTVDNCKSIYNDMGDSHQLNLGLELIRATELLFQPSIIGCSEAGLGETIEHVFKMFNPEDQSILAQNIFITGGCANFAGLKERLTMELTQIRPFGSQHHISVATLPSLDAWNGAKDLSSDTSIAISKADYYEKGGEYLRSHRASNIYTKSPTESIADDN